MKQLIAILVVLLALAACAAGCAGTGGGPVPAQEQEPANNTLFSVLDEDTRRFLEAFPEDSAAFMTVYYDQHYPEAITADTALMRRMVDALSAVCVTASTDVASTDGYHSVRFLALDGTEYAIHFENRVMCRDNERYVLGNDKEFWKLFRSVAETGWEQAQQNTAQYESAPVSYANEALPQCVSGTLVSVEGRESSEPAWLDASAVLRFTNGSAALITGVTLSVRFLNEDGYVTAEEAVTADFSVSPIAPGQTGEYAVARRVYDFSASGQSAGGVRGALIEITGVRTDEDAAQAETPLFAFYGDPALEAFAQDFYNDPPASLTVKLYWYSPTEYTMTDVETVAAAFEVLRRMRIGEVTRERYTDYDTHAVFTYADGREYVISFNGGNLMLPASERPQEACYRVTGGEDFGALIQALSEQ